MNIPVNIISATKCLHLNTRLSNVQHGSFDFQQDSYTLYPAQTIESCMNPFCEAWRYVAEDAPWEDESDLDEDYFDEYPED